MNKQTTEYLLLQHIRYWAYVLFRCAMLPRQKNMDHQMLISSRWLLVLQLLMTKTSRKAELGTIALNILYTRIVLLYQIANLWHWHSLNKWNEKGEKSKWDRLPSNFFFSFSFFILIQKYISARCVIARQHCSSSSIGS